MTARDSPFNSEQNPKAQFRLSGCAASSSSTVLLTGQTRNVKPLYPAPSILSGEFLPYKSNVVNVANEWYSTLLRDARLSHGSLGLHKNAAAAQAMR